MATPPPGNGGLSVDLRQHPILYVDDEQDNLDAFRFSFRRSFDVHTALGGEQALQRLQELQPSVLVVDQRMPSMSGLELLAAARARHPDAVGLLLTAYTDIEVLVEAINSGLVYRYMTKPWDSQELRVVLRQAIERHVLVSDNRRLVARLEELNRYLAGELRERVQPGEIVGHSQALEAVLDAVHSVAPTNATVLLRGPSGTGKELVARAVHDNSARRERPFVRVACAALSPGVLESELFGHEKGAFTGAHQRKLGRFELAEGGTLFLDEIGDLPGPTQVKLLRVLQEREFERVGGTRTIRLDVRLVGATHQNLEALIAQGRFRQDLYFRLNVFPIVLPSLRERVEDIPILARHFLEHFRRSMARPGLRLSADALAALMAYGWPGNVRELENVMERAVILARDGVIGPELLQLQAPPGPPQTGLTTGQLHAEGPAVAPASDTWPPPYPAPAPAPAAPAPSAAAPDTGPPSEASLAARMDELERGALLRALERSGGSKAEAARVLGINRSTLYYRLKKHGLSAE